MANEAESFQKQETKTCDTAADSVLLAARLPYSPSVSQQTRRSLCIIINYSPALHLFPKKYSDSDKTWLASVDHSIPGKNVFDRALAGAGDKPRKTGVLY